MSYIQVDIAEYKAHVHKLLEAHPELAEDDELRADMILGETEIDRIASRLVRIIGERKARAEGLTGYITELQERKARELRAVEGARDLLRSILQAGNIDKLSLPEATVSITKPRIKCIVDDVNELPQGYFVTERRAKTAEIKAALEAGEEIPGARLALGDEGLTVRTK